jgi:hypothetical protein
VSPSESVTSGGEWAAGVRCGRLGHGDLLGVATGARPNCQSTAQGGRSASASPCHSTLANQKGCAILVPFTSDPFLGFSDISDCQALRQVPVRLAEQLRDLVCAPSLLHQSLHDSTRGLPCPSLPRDSHFDWTNSWGADHFPLRTSRTPSSSREKIILLDVLRAFCRMKGWRAQPIIAASAVIKCWLRGEDGRHDRGESSTV